VGASMVRYQSGPVPAGGMDLDAGASRTFVWQYEVEQAGELGLTGAVTATDAWSGNAIAASDSRVLIVARKFEDTALAAYPNPTAGDRLNVALNLQGDASEVEVELYDTGFQRVFRGLWRNVTQAEGTVVVDGIRKLSPGLYLLRARAKLVSGGQQKFPLTRVVVSR